MPSNLQHQDVASPARTGDELGYIVQPQKTKKGLPVDDRKIPPCPGPCPQPDQLLSLSGTSTDHGRSVDMHKAQDIGDLFATSWPQRRCLVSRDFTRWAASCEPFNYLPSLGTRRRGPGNEAYCNLGRATAEHPDLYSNRFPAPSRPRGPQTMCTTAGTVDHNHATRDPLPESLLISLLISRPRVVRRVAPRSKHQKAETDVLFVSLDR